jgi:DUF438 domain-containing protein
MEWQRGTLTPEQVELVLRTLPVDVSFADENDVLVYWKGDSYKTCDARYIGRNVRDCHPESTLADLEEILRRFKAGTQDTFERYARRKDRLSFTRYFAVRDRDGSYRGILEVTQDVTRIRDPEGDQPLLDGGK